MVTDIYSLRAIAERVDEVMAGVVLAVKHGHARVSGIVGNGSDALHTSCYIPKSRLYLRPVCKRLVSTVGDCRRNGQKTRDVGRQRTYTSDLLAFPFRPSQRRSSSVHRNTPASIWVVGEGLQVVV